jgi:hypothetical protein
VVNGKPSPLGVNIYRFPSLPKNRSFVHRSARQGVAALADVFGLDDAAPKCACRVQGAFDLDLDSPSRSMLGVQWL